MEILIIIAVFIISFITGALIVGLYSGNQYLSVTDYLISPFVGLAFWVILLGVGNMIIQLLLSLTFH